MARPKSLLPDFIGAASIVAAFLALPLFTDSARVYWESVSTVAFSPDGRYLAAGLYEGTCFNNDLRWCVGDMQETVVLFDRTNDFEPILLDQSWRPQPQVGLPGRHLGEFLSFAPDGTLLASGTLDGSVKLWSLPSLVLERTLDASRYAVSAVAFSPDGQLVAGGTLIDWTLWNRKTWQDNCQNGPLQIMSISFSPDSRYLAVGGRPAELEIWDLPKLAAAGVQSRMWDLPEGASLQFRAPAGNVCSLRFAPDGSLLAIGGEDKVSLWDAKRNQQRFELPVEGSTGVAFSPDGETLAVTGKAGVSLWNPVTGTRKESPLLGGDARCVAYAADGRFIATGHRMSDQVTVWDAASGKRIWTGWVPHKPRFGWHIPHWTGTAIFFCSVACGIAIFTRRLWLNSPRGPITVNDAARLSRESSD